MRGTLIAVASLVAAPAAAQVTHTVVAASGAPAAGGGTYTGFNTRGPSLNAAGQLAFTATVSGGGTNSGVFRATGPTVTAVARQNAAAAGGAGTFGTFEVNGAPAPALNASGQVAFRGILTDGSSDLGLFRYDAPATGTVIALNAAAAPGGGGNFDGLSAFLHLSSGGQVAFYSALADGSAAEGVYRGDGATTTLVARQGGNAPGPGAGQYDATTGSPRGNAAGQLGQYWGLSGGSRLEGLYRFSGTANVAVVLDGQAAPDGAGNFNGFQNDPPALNAGGQMAFTSSLEAGLSSAGVFRTDGTTTTTIALQGTAAPGGAGNFAALFRPEINAGGQVAFVSSLTAGANTAGVFRGDGATVTAVALQGGAAAPGTTAPFASLSFDSVRVNDAGQVAFRGILLVGGAVTTANDSGLWFGSSTADLALVAREGDVLVVDGVNKTLGQLPATFEFTETGLAWRAVFTDNSSAIIYSTFTPVPEPTTVLGVAVLVLGCARVRRGRRGHGPEPRRRQLPATRRSGAGSY